MGGGANNNRALTAYLKQKGLTKKVNLVAKYVATTQFVGTFVFIVVAITLARMSFTEFEQFVQDLNTLYGYFKSFFFKVNTAPLPSVAANLVDVTSVPIKDSGLQTVPSMSSTPPESHEVKSGVSRKVKIYIGVYICVAIIIFSATGYFPFVILDIYVVLWR